MQGNSREELIYFAGLFDGEGSIMIVRQNSPTFMKNRIYPYYGVVIRIGMLHEEIIRNLGKFLQYGAVYKEKPYHHKRPIVRWMCRRIEEVKLFLVELGPFLRVKQPNVILALEFIDKCNDSKRRKITEEIHQLQHSYYIKMRELNGINSPATTERMGHQGRSKGLRVQATV